MQKKFLNNCFISISIIAILLIMINSSQMEECFYMNLSFMDGMTLIFAVVFAYFLMERGNDERQKKEYCERLIIKIQTQLDEDFLRNPTVEKRKQILMTIRSIQNKISILMSVNGTNPQIIYIKEYFSRYEELYGNHCMSRDMLNENKDKFENMLISISDKLEELLGDVYK